jgi:hypothetical protein
MFVGNVENIRVASEKYENSSCMPIILVSNMFYLTPTVILAIFCSFLALATRLVNTPSLYIYIPGIYNKHNVCKRCWTKKINCSKVVQYVVMAPQLNILPWEQGKISNIVLEAKPGLSSPAKHGVGEGHSGRTLASACIVIT